MSILDTTICVGIEQHAINYCLLIQYVVVFSILVENSHANLTGLIKMNDVCQVGERNRASGFSQQHKSILDVFLKKEYIKVLDLGHICISVKVTKSSTALFECKCQIIVHQFSTLKNGMNIDTIESRNFS